MSKRRLTRSQRVRKADRAMKAEGDDKLASRILGEIMDKDKDEVLDTSDLGQSIKFFALKNGIDPLTGEKLVKTNKTKKRRRRK